jgi:hypothetical protein
LGAKEDQLEILFLFVAEGRETTLQTSAERTGAAGTAAVYICFSMTNFVKSSTFISQLRC